MVFTKVCLSEFFLSGNLQIFGLTRLSTALQYKFQNGKSEFNFFWEFWMWVTYIKTFAGAPDHICSFCNFWTLLTFSQKPVSGMLIYQLAINLKYMIGCWISHNFTFKNVLTWFVISKTCEFKMSFRFPLSFIYFSKLSAKI